MVQYKYERIGSISLRPDRIPQKEPASFEKDAFKYSKKKPTGFSQTLWKSTENQSYTFSF